MIMSYVIKDLRDIFWILYALFICVQSENTEFCQNEVFQANCNPRDEVVFVQKSTYGRMQWGRCIERDYGYVGQCFKDALSVADSECSGRRSCEIRVPNSKLDALRPCPNDLKAYFEVKYVCAKVLQTSQPICPSFGFIPVHVSGTGHLASVITEETNQGSTDCPWMLKADKGQRINITLIDFGILTNMEDICHAYAIIREKDPTRTSTICGRKQRISHEYLSTSNAVEIRILYANRHNDAKKYFLLKYEVLGCADPIIPSGAILSRLNDKARITCTNNQHEWEIICVNNTWKGLVENCTIGGILGEIKFGGTALPFGLSIVVIVGIALGIGMCILLAGLFVLKWQRASTHRRNQQKAAEILHSYQPAKYDPHIIREQFHPDQENSYSTENEYAYIDDLIPPPVTQNGKIVNTRPTMNGFVDYQDLPPYTPHRVNIPQKLNNNNPYNQNYYRTTGELPPDYFELDPGVESFNENENYLAQLESFRARPLVYQYDYMDADSGYESRPYDYTQDRLYKSV